MHHPTSDSYPHFSRLHHQNQPHSRTRSDSNPAWAVSFICIVVNM
jgi:hypothetical protein